MTTTQESRGHKYLIWSYLAGVALVSLLLLKVIMWMDGVR